jgi:hypothetical protein
VPPKALTIVDKINIDSSDDEGDYLTVRELIKQRV